MNISPGRCRDREHHQSSANAWPLTTALPPPLLRQWVWEQSQPPARPVVLSGSQWSRSILHYKIAHHPEPINGKSWCHCPDSRILQPGDRSLINRRSSPRASLSVRKLQSTPLTLVCRRGEAETDSKHRSVSETSQIAPKSKQSKHWFNYDIRLLPGGRCRKAKLWSVPEVQTPSTGLTFSQEEGAGKRSLEVCPKSKLQAPGLMMTSFFREEGAGKRSFEVWQKSKRRALVYDILFRKAKLWVCPKSKLQKLV